MDDGQAHATWHAVPSHRPGVSPLVADCGSVLRLIGLADGLSTRDGLSILISTLVGLEVQSVSVN